ncbi:MAG: Wadjet anti-phage system protein JetD domain-containing protein [Burkholderiales bacterium]
MGDLARQILGAPEGASFHAVCGLRTEPSRMRVRVLCPQLRVLLGGLCDIESPAVQIAAMPIRPQICLIVENQNTGIALPDMPGAVVFMQLGLAVDQLDPIAWLHDADHQVYWGDLDTHGFAALARARRRFPRMVSILMDEATLLAHRSMWVREDKPSKVESPEGLTPEELAVYEGLRINRWDEQVRLEQERISWPTALHKLRSAGWAGN